MTLYQIVRRLETLALTAPNVRTASDGDVYAGMNDNPELKYGVFFITQNTHQELEDRDRYGLTLFYIDRLDDTLEDNRLQIQSIGKEIISVVLRDFCEEYDVDLPTINYTPFTQKFKDETAGVYAQIIIELIKGVCVDDYSEVVSIYQTKIIDIDENGQYIVTPDPNYTALDKVIINVDVKDGEGYDDGFKDGYESGYTNGYNDGLEDCGKDYDEGFEDGKEAQKALLSAITITVNGDYTREDGYSAITVNVPQTGHTDQELEDAFNSGITYQQSLLSAITITENGDYTREDGYSAITVDVPQTGYTQEDLDNAFESGVTSGITYQKSLLVSTAFTQNGDYTRENGWSAVTVNVQTDIKYHRLTVDFSQSEGVSGLVNKAVVTVSNSSGSTNYTYSGSNIVVDLLPGMSYTVSYGNVAKYNKPSSSTVTTVWSGSTTLYPVYTQIPALEVSPSAKTISYLNQTFNITVTSNTGWTITNYPSWATPNVLSGTGNATVVVSVTENTGSQRTSSIQFTTVDSSEQQSVSVKQNTFNIKVTPLTFEIVSGGTIYYVADWSTQYSDADNVTGLTIQYSKNDGNKVSIQPTRNGTAITANAGDIFRFYGDNDSYSIGRGFAHFISYENFGDGQPAKFKVYGNAMSLIRSTNFSSMTSFPSSNANFYGLFKQCKYLLNDSTKDLVLPATTLTSSCYQGMFSNCSYLEKAPELPATTMGNDWNNCYSNMFRDCTRLNYVKCLSTALTSTKVTTYSPDWLNGVAATGTFVKNPDLTSWSTGVSGIPSGWTIIDNS